MQALWVWLALGLAILAAEMATGTIYMLWFGISALCVSALLWVIPNIAITLQLVIFALLSFVSLAVWKFYYKKQDVEYRIGQSKGEEIGRLGTVTKACGPDCNGTIQFTQGLMGSREWTAVSDIPIEQGEQARVLSVEGNSLRITKS